MCMRFLGSLTNLLSMTPLQKLLALDLVRLELDLHGERPSLRSAAPRHGWPLGLGIPSPFRAHFSGLAKHLS